MGKRDKRFSDFPKGVELIDANKIARDRKFTEPNVTNGSRSFTKSNTVSGTGKLTVSNETRFIVSFRYKLLSGYKFTDLQWKDIKTFQQFLDKTSQMTFNQVETLYHRDDDSKDLYNGEQITHYKVTDSFRIHGVLENSQFVVLRLDPNHRVHGH